MTVKIPATILHIDPDTSARRVANAHRKRMYDTLLEETSIVVRKAIRQDAPWVDGTREVEKWIGSERWLWNYLKALGSLAGNYSHERYEDDFSKPFLSGTEKAPVWTRNRTVYKRHKCELIYIDNIDRLYARFLRSDVGREYRQSMRGYGFTRRSDPFEYACVNSLSGLSEWKGLTPAQFTDDYCRSVIRHFRLYRISSREFFRRNRYSSVVWDHRHYRNRPYKQKNGSNAAILEVLRSRLPNEARLDRLGTPLMYT